PHLFEAHTSWTSELTHSLTEGWFLDHCVQCGACPSVDPSTLPRYRREHPARELDGNGATVGDERRAVHVRRLVRGEEEAARRHLLGRPRAPQRYVRRREVVGAPTIDAVGGCELVHGLVAHRCAHPSGAERVRAD